MDDIIHGNKVGSQRDNPSALESLRSILPSGDMGHIINSFIFCEHPSATEWQRHFRQGMHDARTTVCPFVIDPYLTENDSSDIAVARGTLMLADLHVARGGWGYIAACQDCEAIIQLSVCHESAGLNMNLKIKTAVMWNGDNAGGFEIAIGDCVCGNYWRA
jgi:hypothetical protein